MSLIDHNFKLTSGERVSTVAPDDIPPDHIARYHFAVDCISKIPNPSGVLIGADIFCGSGYGSHIIAQRLPCFLTGIDGSAEAVQRAANHYTDLNLLFSHKFFPFYLPPCHFDFIVSIESIEHVENGDLLMQVLAQAVKPGGILVLSAPNSEVIDLIKNPYPWHYRHYTKIEILDLAKNNGLKHVCTMGADCTVVNTDGKVVCANYYSPVSAQLREDHAGDTLTHLFIKTA